MDAFPMIQACVLGQPEGRARKCYRCGGEYPAHFQGTPVCALCMIREELNGPVSDS